jgi:cbb3-type cytochrome oxidase maturation protein
MTALPFVWILFLGVLVIGMGAWLIFLWAVRTGQFRDAEGTAERMLELEEGEEGPSAAARPGARTARTADRSDR